MPSLSTIVAEHPDLLTTIVIDGVEGTNIAPLPPQPIDVMKLPPVLQPATMQDLQSILGGTQGLQNVLGGAPPPNMSMAPMDPAMNPLMPNPTIDWKTY